MNVFDRIELNPRICNGKPVIKGTRIPISVILELIVLWIKRSESTMYENIVVDSAQKPATESTLQRKR